MKEFEPLAGELKVVILSAMPRKEAMSWGDVKSVLSGSGTQSNLARGGLAAVAAGTIGAVSQTKREWESEDEFRRRKFRTMLGYAASAGAIAGFAQPAFEKYKELVSNVESKNTEEMAGAEQKAELERQGKLITKSKVLGKEGKVLEDLKDDATAYSVAASGPGTSGVWQGGGAVVGGVAGWKGSDKFQQWNPHRGNIHGVGLVKSGSHVRGPFLKNQSQRIQRIIADPSSKGRALNEFSDRIRAHKDDINYRKIVNARPMPTLRQAIRHPAASASRIMNPFDPATKGLINASKDQIRQLKSDRSAMNRSVSQYHGNPVRNMAFRTGGTLGGVGVGYAVGSGVQYLFNKSMTDRLDAITQDLQATAANQ